MPQDRLDLSDIESVKNFNPMEKMVKKTKWSLEEDTLIIGLRGSGKKWEDVSALLPGRSAVSCRLHYQNYLERRSEWDEDRKNKLATLYNRLKSEMWAKVAEELAVPWRTAEAMHWQIGEKEMAQRAGVVPFYTMSGETPRKTAPQREDVPLQTSLKAGKFTTRAVYQMAHEPQLKLPPLQPKGQWQTTVPLPSLSEVTMDVNEEMQRCPSQKPSNSQGRLLGLI